MPRLPKMVPHTAAKHLLLRRYLDRWFPILGKYHTRINYIDGFAGPGEYEGGEPGSPILALESARHHVENGTLAPNVEINFVFVEADSGGRDPLSAMPQVADTAGFAPAPHGAPGTPPTGR